MSQNELQRVVAELDELIARDEEQQDYCSETGPNEAMRRVVALIGIRRRLIAAASRIESAQAVAPGGVPDDVMQAIRWKLDTGDHTLDETCCCQPYCEACKAEQGEWKEIWDADRDLLQEVFDKYSMLAAAPASESATEQMRKVIERIKFRLHFIGWPAEAFWNSGTEEAPHWIADWRYEIALIENALHGAPITVPEKPDDTKPRHAITLGVPASETKDCTCYKYEGRDCRRCFNPPYPDDATSSAAGESDPVQRAVDDAIAKGQDPYLAGITAMAKQSKGPCCEHAGTFLCACGKFTLIEKPPTVESIAEMKHLLCWAYDNLNDMPVSDEWAAGWCKEFGETEFGKTLMCNEPAASCAARDTIAVCDLAAELNKKASEVIRILFDMGVMATLTQKIDGETAQLVREVAEQEQAGELPEPVSSVALAAWGPKPDYYTADQMHAFYRKGYDAALLRRAAMVEVAAVEVLNTPYGLSHRFDGRFYELPVGRYYMTAALEPKE